jgi:transcriptional regulator with XRE-family HTH domain
MDKTSDSPVDLAGKIARLVEERGWNQEEFARIAGLNRHTVRHILIPGGTQRLRNATVLACARALNVTVNDLRTLSLGKLLARAAEAVQSRDEEAWRRLYRLATQPELTAWIERNPERARALDRAEVEEVLALQERGALLTFGVEAFIERLERRRRLVQQVLAIAGTEYLELLEQLVVLLYEKVQPGRET